MPHCWFAEHSCLHPGRKRAVGRFLRRCRRLSPDGAPAVAAFLESFDWHAGAGADAMRVKTADNPLLQLQRARLLEAVCMVFARGADALQPSTAMLLCQCSPCRFQV